MNIHRIYLLFQKFFRPRRMKEFVKFFGVDNNTRILDIGGRSDVSDAKIVIIFPQGN